jgi:hypothetical protein
VVWGSRKYNSSFSNNPDPKQYKTPTTIPLQTTSLFKNTTNMAEKWNSSNTRTLEVRYTSWDVKIEVIDNTMGGQTLYRLSGSSLGTELTALNGSGQLIGMGKSSHWKTGVSISLAGNNGATFETSTGKSFGRGSPSYVSPAFGGQKMTWKNKAMSTKIIYTLLDERGMALARLESAGMKWTKPGKLEIMEDLMMDEAKRDEIVVTVLTLMYRKLVQNNTAAIV